MTTSIQDIFWANRRRYGSRRVQKALLEEGIEMGRYRVRLIIDANGNRKRDIGNVQKGIQPEAIIYHPGAEEGGLIQLKQNFELTDIDF